MNSNAAEVIVCRQCGHLNVLIRGWEIALLWLGRKYCRKCPHLLGCDCRT